MNPNPKETAEEAAKGAKDAGIAFPVLPDPKQEIASRLGVERTTEILVFDPARKIRYRGAVDDQYSVGNRKPAPQRHYLAEALDAVLAGKPVIAAQTKVQGCLIGKESPRRRPPPAALPTYHKDVAPILRKHCGECHRAGEIGPFALQTYDDAEGVSRMIGEVIEQGRMPLARRSQIWQVVERAAPHRRREVHHASLGSRRRPEGRSRPRPSRPPRRSTAIVGISALPT